MPSTNQLRTRLIEKLKELFQLNQPDLDFGFYRIMHAKAEEVIRFLEDDLLKHIANTFEKDAAATAQTTLAEAQRKVRETLGDEAVNADGTIQQQYEGTKIAKEYLHVREALTRDGEETTIEGEIYDHLYRFFSRYYEDGDFVSLRYYAPETAGRAAPYVIPYNGEEVKLHWANADQYYVKTSEYFNHFTFDLATGAREQLAKNRKPGKSNQEQELDLGETIPDKPLRVHFRIVEAQEGEHNNVKTADDNKRFFLLHKPQPITVDDAGELTIQFEYRADSDKAGQAGKWQETKNAEAVSAVLNALATFPEAAPYLPLLTIPAPTPSDKSRKLLAKYIAQYAARNTSDYFIHKNLGDFLRRELDFYLKNEVMRLDDVVNMAQSDYSRYIRKLGTLRTIAGQLIAFLAQLEDFQKKLWLKKKFVVETNYCITLDRVPEALYPEIVANAAQWQEWEKLGFLSALNPAEFALAGDATEPLAPSVPSVALLKANPYLVLDTRFFDESFKARLIAAIDNFDEQCDGLLIHSENFQALNLLQERYREQVKCVYIDPPYNTGSDDFPYKDGYQASTWYTMMHDRVLLASGMMNKSALFFLQIGDQEAARSRILLEDLFSERKNSVVVRRGVKNVQAQFEDIDHLSLGHDIVHVCAKQKGLRIPHLRQVLTAGKIGKWDTFWRGTDRPTMRYELFGQTPETGQWRWEKNRATSATQAYRHYLETESANKTIDEWWAENLQTGDDIDFVRLNDDNVVQYYIPPQDYRLVSDNWLDIPASGSETEFAHEKSLALLRRILLWNTQEKDVFLDFFGGSGSTAHAACRPGIDCKRKYILVEMGDYFDTVLKPRISKVVYSKDWKDCKPISRDTGISHCFKVLRLESYEDTLNNLTVALPPESQRRELAQSATLREEYMLHYLLDVETQGSPSLLNLSAFADPTAYTLRIKRPGSDEYEDRAVDLLETFNYLIGLRVVHLDAPQTYDGVFTREKDPALPDDTHTRLTAQLKPSPDGAWRFRKVEGWVPSNRLHPEAGGREKVLIVWRNLTDDIEKDNALLDAWFQKNRINTRDFEFDTIYVNGSNNLPNLCRDGDRWKVVLTEEEFTRRMWANT